MKLCSVQKIVSGGQVGADRAGLDVALVWKIDHGGYCPKGRLALDGKVPKMYNLTEAWQPGYPARTKLNVHHSDGTVIFTSMPPGRGSQLTISMCVALGKPYLVLTPDDGVVLAARKLKEFLEADPPVTVLNVAGGRQTKFYDLARETLQRVLRLCEKVTPPPPRNASSAKPLSGSPSSKS